MTLFIFLTIVLLVGLIGGMLGFVLGLHVAYGHQRQLQRLRRS